MNLRNSSGIELRNFYFTTVQKLVSKIFIRSGKLHHVGSIQVLPNQVSKKSFYMFEDIDLRESLQSYIKTERNSGSRFNLKVRTQYLLSSSELLRISAVFCTVFVHRN